MSGMHAPWQEFRQGIGELVGIRAGLALTNDRIDRHLGLNVEEPMPPGLVRVSASQYKEALFSALLECGSRWCDLGPYPRVMAWQQLSMDTDLYIAAHDLIHRQVHEQGVGFEHQTHAGCGLVGQDEEFLEHIRGPAVVAKLDMSVLNSRLDDLDMSRAEGQAFQSGGEALVRATRLLIAALRSDQHIDPWLRCKTAHATSIADLSDLFTRSDCPSNSSEFFDQRFIDFLVANVEELPLIHWRQFERLVAEYLHRQGYSVQLGPGSNDDGVDIRVWPSEAESGGSSDMCLMLAAALPRATLHALQTSRSLRSHRGGVEATQQLSTRSPRGRRAHLSLASLRCTEAFPIRSQETVSFANVPKSVPIGIETALREIAEGRFGW
jgi:hypothetical protein